MKRIYYIILLVCLVGFSACKKTIDLYPQSNQNANTYYSNFEEVRTGLTACYNGMQRSLFNEWQFTELRSDNAKQGSPGSTASGNRDLSDLDMLYLPPRNSRYIITGSPLTIISVTPISCWRIWVWCMIRQAVR